MNRQISAAYGLTLQQACEAAIATYTREKPTAATCKFGVNYSFDYHGLEIPMNESSTVDSLMAEIRREHQVRADWYDARPALPETYIREQHGRVGEYLYEAIPASIQCAQRWGNLWYDKSGVHSIEHVFEFNGCKVAFNPWKIAEGARIQHAIEAQLLESRQPRRYYVVLPENV